MNNAKKQIAILGDSLPLHRENENISSTQTYSFLLGEILGNTFDVSNRARRNNHVLKQMLLENLYGDVSDETQYCIIQLGIVDCYPRVFSEKLHQKLCSISNNSLFKKLLISLASKYRYTLTKFFPKSYVKYQDFRYNYENIVRYILERKKTKKIFLINIAKTPDNIANRTYGALEIIKKYNDGIKEIAIRYDKKVKLVDFYTLTQNEPDLLLEDGQHISIKGNEILAKLLSDEILSIESLGNTNI